MRALGGMWRLAGLIASFNGGDNRMLMQTPIGEEVLHVSVHLLELLTQDAGPQVGI